MLEMVVAGALALSVSGVAPEPRGLEFQVSELVAQVADAPREQPRSKALTAMYLTFGALQVADIHSTTRALNNGGVEANPAMRAIVGNRAAFIAVKAAGGAATIFAAEKLRKKHPVAAFVLMASLNTVMATVVAHNYRID